MIIYRGFRFRFVGKRGVWKYFKEGKLWLDLYFRKVIVDRERLGRRG